MNCVADEKHTVASVKALLVGYGNALRADDGAGPAIVSRICEQVPADVCRGISVHQLAPELAEDLSGVPMVIFVDASLRLKAGRTQVTRLVPTAPSSRGLTHHVSPTSLLWIAQTVFGHAPEALLIEIGGQDFAAGESLSPTVSRAADRIVRHVTGWLNRGLARPMSAGNGRV